jgi:hypothetical protein
VPENGSVYVNGLKTGCATLKLMFLGTTLSKGPKTIEKCPFSFEEGNRATFPNVVHSESVVYVNQTS